MDACEELDVEAKIRAINLAMGRMPAGGTYFRHSVHAGRRPILLALQVIGENLDALADGLAEHFAEHEQMRGELDDMRRQRDAIRDFLGVPR